MRDECDAGEAFEKWHSERDAHVCGRDVCRAAFAEGQRREREAWQTVPLGRTVLKMERENADLRARLETEEKVVQQYRIQFYVQAEQADALVEKLAAAERDLAAAREALEEIASSVVMVAGARRGGSP